jgi:RNA polymerase sigma-70 factor (ECF subfamily)
LQNTRKQDPKFIERETKFDSNEYKELIEEALAQLDPKDRSIVTLFYIDNMSTKEIAFLLNESEENIRVRLHRARNKLREAIENGEV